MLKLKSKKIEEINEKKINLIKKAMNFQAQN